MDKQNRLETNTLLTKYRQYKAIAQLRDTASSKLAKAKIRGVDTTIFAQDYADITISLQAVSDDMTFSSPIIWMMYKYEAYVNEPQSIRTMHDFRMHCSKPGYICTKRFIFLNNELTKRNRPSLQDHQTYPDSLMLSEVFESHDIRAVTTDTDCTKLWSTYEYYLQDGIVAKWENFNSLSER